jgi:hypothetical protein
MISRPSSLAWYSALLRRLVASRPSSRCSGVQYTCPRSQHAQITKIALHQGQRASRPDSHSACTRLPQTRRFLASHAKCGEGQRVGTLVVFNPAEGSGCHLGPPCFRRRVSTRTVPRSARTPPVRDHFLRIPVAIYNPRVQWFETEQPVSASSPPRQRNPTSRIGRAHPLRRARPHTHACGWHPLVGPECERPGDRGDCVAECTCDATRRHDDHC